MFKTLPEAYDLIPICGLHLPFWKKSEFIGINNELLVFF